MVLLVHGQPSRLQQDRVRNRHLAHVVQKRPARHGAYLLRRQLHRARQGNRVRGHPPGVALGLRIFQVQRVAQRLQRDVVGPLQVPDRAVQHLGAGCHQTLPGAFDTRCSAPPAHGIPEPAVLFPAVGRAQTASAGNRTPHCVASRSPPQRRLPRSPSRSGSPRAARAHDPAAPARSCLSSQYRKESVLASVRRSSCAIASSAELASTGVIACRLQHGGDNGAYRDIIVDNKDGRGGHTRTWFEYLSDRSLEGIRIDHSGNPHAPP